MKIFSNQKQAVVSRNSFKKKNQTSKGLGKLLSSRSPLIGKGQGWLGPVSRLRPRAGIVLSQGAAATGNNA